jgi:radical SAM superfamily enzyme YgiQ (UPF0313 family)
MTPTIGAAIGIAREIKKAKPGLPIILGGAHATLLPKETLATAPEIDILVQGRGRGNHRRVTASYRGKQPLSEIQGISYRKDGGVVSNPARSKNVIWILCLTAANVKQGCFNYGRSCRCRELIL